jgi:aromatic-amino-acid transaminase
VSILNYLGMRHTAYTYFNTETRDVDFDAMMSDLAGVKAGDLVLLHGCCHNPTGANLTLDQWKEVVALINEKGAVPFIDLAYQGFGDGLEADALATRLVAANVGECLIAASCSKNFGIYRERTGILMAIAKDAATAKLSQGMLQFLNRQNYSFPPDHGARVVATILGDDALRQMWIDELEETRLSMLTLRQQLADELKRLTNSDRFDFIAKHRGMFSQIGTTPEKVEVMRAESGIYMVSDSRLNIAGLNATTVPLLAKAIVDAGV